MTFFVPIGASKEDSLNLECNRQFKDYLDTYKPDLDMNRALSDARPSRPK